MAARPYRSSAFSSIDWYTCRVTRLLLGPLLRHVGATDATIWVETDAPCEVGSSAAVNAPGRSRGHHYALVASTVWSPGPARRTRCGWTATGSGRCPTSRPPSRGSGRSTRRAGADRVRVVPVRQRPPRSQDDRVRRRRARRLRRQLVDRPRGPWPDALLLLGDQVYADETSPQTQDRIRRAPRHPPRAPRTRSPTSRSTPGSTTSRGPTRTVRWLLSTVPTSMIFDDHDVRDDWNTSQVLAAGHAGQPLVAGADHRRAVLVLGVPAPGQPVADRTGRRRAVPAGADARRRRASRCCGNSRRGRRRRGGRRQGRPLVVPARLRCRSGCWSSTRGAAGSSTTADRRHAQRRRVRLDRASRSPATTTTC